MFDYGKTTIKINCANCNFEHIITLRQIANEESKLCQCGELMLFQDNDGEFKKLIIRMNIKSGLIDGRNSEDENI